MFYTIENNKLKKYSSVKFSNDCLETDIINQKDLDKCPNKIVVKEGKLVLNPNYEEEQRQKEIERIKSLTLTKRVFALALQQIGITYSQLKELIATNEQAQLEWDLCVELERSNPLLDIMASELGITPEQLDEIFVLANQESEV